MTSISSIHLHHALTNSINAAGALTNVDFAERHGLADQVIADIFSARNWLSRAAAELNAFETEYRARSDAKVDAP